MTTKISQEMITPAAIPALMAETLVGKVEVGDFCWSARSAKTGWLLCQAQAVSRTTYADLFDEIGTTWGAGNGTTTFNLPDGQGRALIGVGSGAGLTARALADDGGAETHVLTVGEMPAHTHSGGMGGGGGSYAGGGANTERVPASTGSQGGGGAHNNMQPFLAANLFIYAGV